jgi:hypothetical protein
MRSLELSESATLPLAQLNFDQSIQPVIEIMERDTACIDTACQKSIERVGERKVHLIRLGLSRTIHTAATHAANETIVI